MILQTSLATGVADDQLRPALQRLAVSTKSTEEAQKLLTLALDISKASGKDLETVTNALGRAQDGNVTSLGRLGLAHSCHTSEYCPKSLPKPCGLYCPLGL